MSDRPLDVLENSLGGAVTVRLKSGDVYEGELESYDQHMNLVISEAETDNTTIIRGDNVVTITP